MHHAAKIMIVVVLPVLFAFLSAASAQTLVVLNKYDGTVSMLDAADGRPFATVGVGIGPHEAATSPDGETVVVCDYGQRTPGSTLSVIDMTRQQTMRTIDLSPYQRPHGIVYLSDGQRVVVTAEAQRKLLIVNVPRGEVEAAIDTDQDVSHMVAVTPDERLAFVPNIRSGSVSVIDLRDRELKKIIETGAGAEGVAAHPTRPEVWVANRSADNISIIDTRSLEATETLETGSFPIRAAITPDGAHALVSCARSGDVWVYDVASRGVKARISMNEEPVGADQKQQRLFSDRFGESPVPIGILIQPDGRRAYVANTNADVITVLDLTEWRIVDRFRAGREPDGLAWVP